MGGPPPHSFATDAAAYAAHRPEYPGALADFLADLAPGRRLAWDAGCGSGQLSVPLARRFDRVVATDASAEQLAHATAHPRVEYRVAFAEASGLSDAAVDLAAAAQAVHWFDLEAYYTEVRRVLRPKGVVALVSYALPSVGEPADRVLRRFYSGVLGSYWAPARRHVDSGYRTLPFPFEEVPAPPFAIRCAWTLAELLGYVRTWSAVRALVRAEGERPLDILGDELRALWGGDESKREIVWSLALRVGRV